MELYLLMKTDSGRLGQSLFGSSKYNEVIPHKAMYIESLILKFDEDKMLASGFRKRLNKERECNGVFMFFNSG